MKTAQRIWEAARKLAAQRPLEKLTYADIAREAGVHWTTVQRYFGSKQAMQARLAAELQEDAPDFADTRSKILAAANRVFARQGYAGATLDDVAEAAGMTKGAVYWHFASKNDLFLALCERSLAQLLAGLPEQFRRVLTASDPPQAMSQLLAAEFATCERGDGEKPLLFFEFIAHSRDPDVKEKLDAAFSALFAGTAQILADMQQNRLVNEQVDPRSLAVMLHALINGMVLMWLVAPQQVSLSSLAAEVAAILWTYMQPASET
ncbi:TetR/AcrR family transcriptional regulator [Brevibacillus marinus]|uniref:TetR/AcrR family transcriptional regulator n=1 Tax=Brevibacillus marinus TaxID=2496837 RepID=UPI000F8373A3|nr:TetR family transcriptional regulator [Brevibacillus marinus]